MKLDHLPLFVVSERGGRKSERASEGAAAEEEQNRVSKKEESCAIIQWGSAAGEARRQMNIFELAWRGVVPFRFTH